MHQADRKEASSGDDGASNKKSDAKDRRKPPAEVSRALRSVYDDTLREDVPDDFMDLLGKLS
ncbi:hypothetical protein G7077_10375 [Sphingomonas piscis]|uniref:Anti-sigma factor NepR domain-containing protein n=1 Tax=Sphingomonas piscis TaxID=2714943 RepID=A0A6G7YR86_9SPHN|nr:NepR family anti-sigma factor [Sphingomonas piscis]QIK79244.1 hypothetical protein G7077_10375 [Sphingomonas piscis]